MILIRVLLSSRGNALLSELLIEEVKDKDWEELQQGSGLQAVAARLFRNPSRQHVNLLTFSSDRTPPKRAGNIVSFSATNLKFVNPHPEFPLPKSFLQTAVQ